MGCDNLKHIDLVGGIHETITALQLKEWREDLNEEVNSINRILFNAPARDDYDWQDGEKTAARRP